MNDEQIGIKLADGSFYPVLEEGFAGRKRLVLTTVRDNQDAVQIDLYRGKGQRAEQTRYVGSLSIEGIAAAPQREPEIQLELGIDEAGTLEAVAQDARTGEKQTLSISLEGGEAATPQFELESDGGLVGPEEEQDEGLLTGETYPVGAADRRKEHLHRRPARRRPLLLVLLLILSLILIAAIAFVVYRSLSGEPLPAMFGRARSESAAPPAVAVAQPAAPAAAAAPLLPAAASEPAPPQAAAASPTPAAGLWYRIKWGDTLWDIAGTYYRNPWLYPKIAGANRITNPDLIIAGRQLFIPEN